MTHQSPQVGEQDRGISERPQEARLDYATLQPHLLLLSLRNSRKGVNSLLFLACMDFDGAITFPPPNTPSEITDTMNGEGVDDGSGHPDSYGLVYDLDQWIGNLSPSQQHAPLCDS
jgi:hypothetical protein